MTLTNMLEDGQDSSLRAGSSPQMKRSTDDKETMGSDIGSSYFGLSDNEDEALEEEVDESVREDMRKLEETFRGISYQFRLINKIGEGKPWRPHNKCPH
jgi:hypothetical protein